MNDGLQPLSDMPEKKIVLKIYISIFCLFVPPLLHASFIESTQGTAVVNDATAAYHNPAALTLVTNTQGIALGSIASFHTHFKGQATQAATGFTQYGGSSNQTNYYLPSLYLALPSTKKLNFGLAIISNFFNKNSEENSILRYAQADNSIQDIDLIPALSLKVNSFFSLGVGLSFSRANFILEPLSGFPSLNIPDALSHNEAQSNGIGGDVGLLLRPHQSTLIGFNYRSSVTYHFRGYSILAGTPKVLSNNYAFTFWTPARSVLSLSHALNPSVGFISTVQHIQWSIFNQIRIRGIAARIGTQPHILNADVPYHLHDSWLFTLGAYYRIKPKWVIRTAGTYNQAAEKGVYQISTGDSLSFGLSMGYEINKHLTIDGSFAHAFIQNQTINIMTGRNLIRGINSAGRDALSLKLTYNQLA